MHALLSAALSSGQCGFYCSRKEGRKDAETTWQIHARSNSLDNNHCPPDEISGVISSLLHLFEVSSQLNMPATPFQADDQESS